MLLFLFQRARKKTALVRFGLFLVTELEDFEVRTAMCGHGLHSPRVRCRVSATHIAPVHPLQPPCPPPPCEFHARHLPAGMPPGYPRVPYGKRARCQLRMGLVPWVFGIGRWGLVQSKTEMELHPNGQ